MKKLTVAAKDTIQFPNYVTLDDRPYFQAAFSAIKRDFCFARFLLFEGLLKKNCPAYEANDLYLTDLEDGNFYDLGTEKVKTAFRLVFSVFDSLVSLLFRYIHRNQKLGKADFNGKWIREKFCDIKNPFIRSLYWVACDMRTGSTNNCKAPNPDAEKITHIRNALEHNWLRVSNDTSLQNNEHGNCYAYVITDSELNTLAMKVFQLARSSIVLLVFAVKYHEIEQQKKFQSDKIYTFVETPIWKP